MSKTKSKAKEPTDYRGLQLWPGGKSVDVAGEGKRMLIRSHGWNGDPNGPWHKPTPEEFRAVRIEQIAEQYAERDIYFCDSMLVSDAMKIGDSGEADDFGREFSYENVKNLRTDPDHWTLEQCKEWLEDKGHDLPEPNPWAMDAAALVEFLNDAGGEIGGPEGLDAEDLRRRAVRCIDDGDNLDGTAGGIDLWRDAVQDNAEDAEIYQWFRVSEWLADELDVDDECVLDNAYGQWWGRQCCGQALIMDGTLQKIAARQFDKYPETN